MQNLPPVRVHNQALSLWQSVVAERALDLVKSQTTKEESQRLQQQNVFCERHECVKNLIIR